MLNVSQYVLHHHPDHWDNPDKFNPERFIEQSPVPYTFIPFSVGPRRCLGKNFALLEMKIFLSVWLSRLTFERVKGSEDEIKTRQGALVVPVDTSVIVRQR